MHYRRVLSFVLSKSHEHFQDRVISILNIMYRLWCHFVQEIIIEIFLEWNVRLCLAKDNFIAVMSFLLYKQYFHIFYIFDKNCWLIEMMHNKIFGWKAIFTVICHCFVYSISSVTLTDTCLLGKLHYFFLIKLY